MELDPTSWSLKEPLRLLAVDPGLCIGFCRLTIHARTFELLEMVVAEERTENAKPYGTQPMKYLLQNNINHLILEDYVGSGPLTKEASYTLKQIGWFEAMAADRDVPLRLQTNVMRRRCLKEGAAMYKSLKGKAPCHHGRDALAHALRFIEDEFQYDWRRWLCDY